MNKIEQLTIEPSNQTGIYLIHHPYGPLAFMQSAVSTIVPGSYIPLEQVATELQEAADALTVIRRLFGQDWRAGVEQFEQTVREV